MTTRSRIPNNPRSLAPSATISATSPIGINFPVTTIEVTQRLNCHEVAIFTMHDDFGYETLALDAGAPIDVTWSAPSGSGTFRGYIETTESVVPAFDQRVRVPVRRLICVGCTKPMKNDSTRTFYKTTVPAAIAALCNDRRLACFADSHDTVWGTLAPLAGESEWQSCVRWANMIGYSVVAHGVIVYVVDSTSPRPLSRMVSVINNGEFRPRTSSPYGMSGSELSTKAVAFDGGVVTAAPITRVLGNGYNSYLPVVRNVQTAVSPASMAEAAALAQGAAKNAAFQLGGVLTTGGSANVFAGSVVRLALNTKPAERYDGVWSVAKAEHKVTRNGQYTMDLTLQRDSLGTGSTIVPPPSSVPTVVPRSVWRPPYWLSEWSAQ